MVIRHEMNMGISAHALEFNLVRNYECVNHDEMASRVFFGRGWGLELLILV